jgi:hypothetical protein
MFEEDLWLLLLIIFGFALFMSGLFLGALVSRRKARS